MSKLYKVLQSTPYKNEILFAGTLVDENIVKNVCEEFKAGGNDMSLRFKLENGIVEEKVEEVVEEKVEKKPKK